MSYLLFYLISIFQVPTEPQFRDKLEWKSTLLENNEKGKYTLLQDSLGKHYKVKWHIDYDCPNFIYLTTYSEESYWLGVWLGKPLQFYTGNFFNPWVDVP